jgi:hypothetical protein
MNEAETLFVALRQSADDDVVDMLEHMCGMPRIMP